VQSTFAVNFALKQVSTFMTNLRKIVSFYGFILLPSEGGMQKNACKVLLILKNMSKQQVSY
jgi:hypothetical protein